MKMETMKRIYIFLFALLVLGSQAQAQFLMPAKKVTGSFFRLGIKGGVNMTSIKTDGIFQYNNTNYSNLIKESLDTKQSYSFLDDSSLYPEANKVLDKVFFIGAAPHYTEPVFEYIEKVIKEFK